MIIKMLLTLKTLKMLITTHFSKNNRRFINNEARKMLITTHFGKFICVCPADKIKYPLAFFTEQLWCFCVQLVLV